MKTIKLTEAQILRKVIRHFAQQKSRAVSVGVKGGTCLYRTPRGKSCAIGCLIPDSMYNTSWEGYGVDNVLQDVEFTKVSTGFLSRLQEVHDNNGTLNTLKHDFKLLNQVYNVFPAPQLDKLLGTIKAWR